MTKQLRNDNIKLMLCLSTFLILNFIAFHFYFLKTPISFEVFEIRQITVIMLFITMCTLLGALILRSVLLIRSWIGIPLIYDTDFKKIIFYFTPVKIAIFVATIIGFHFNISITNFIFVFFLINETAVVFINSSSALQDLYTVKERNIDHWLNDYLTEEQKKKMFAVNQSTYTRNLLIRLPNITISEQHDFIRIKGKEYNLIDFKTYIKDKNCNIYELTEQDYLLISMMSI